MTMRPPISTLFPYTTLFRSIEGRFLELLVYSSGAKRVLELGTYSGYSALSMAAGLPPGGQIDTCELDESRAAVARRYIEQDRKSTRLNSSHMSISYAVFCLK